MNSAITKYNSTSTSFGNIWNLPDYSTHLFSRGFTMHEHLDKLWNYKYEWAFV